MEITDLITLTAEEHIIRITPPVSATLNKLVITNKRLFEIGSSPEKIIWECSLDNILKVTNLAVALTIVDNSNKSHVYIPGLYYSTVIANELREAIANISTQQKSAQPAQVVSNETTAVTENTVICPHCGFSALKSDARFCSHCGANLQERKKLICPSCGCEETDMDAKFCSNCGTKLEEGK